VPGLISNRSSVQNNFERQAKRHDFSIIGYLSGPFASSSSAPPRSYRLGVSAAAADALPYSETRRPWRGLPAVLPLPREDWQLLRSNCTEISNPARLL